MEDLGGELVDERDGELVVVRELSMMLERLTVINVVGEVSKDKEVDWVDV